MVRQKEMERERERERERGKWDQLSLRQVAKSLLQSVTVFSLLPPLSLFFSKLQLLVLTAFASRFLGKPYSSYYVTEIPSETRLRCRRSLSRASSSSRNDTLSVVFFFLSSNQPTDRVKRKRARERERERKEGEGNLSGDTEEREKEIPLELASGQWDAKIGLCPASVHNCHHCFSLSLSLSLSYWVCIHAVNKDNQFVPSHPKEPGLCLNQYYFVLELEGIHRPCKVAVDGERGEVLLRDIRLQILSRISQLMLQLTEAQS